MMGTRILYVEDEEDLHLVIGEGLRYLNMNVTILRTAEEALKKLRYEHFEVILLDMTLPGMSGWDFAKRLQQGDYDDIPIIALTGSSHVGDEQKAFQVGCTAFLSKPCETSDVKRKIDEVLEKSKRF